MPASTGGGAIGELSSAFDELGAGQAIDLLKGMVMPAINCERHQAPGPARRAGTCRTGPGTGALVLSPDGTVEADTALRCRYRTIDRRSRRVETLEQLTHT